MLIENNLLQLYRFIQVDTATTSLINKPYKYLTALFDRKQHLIESQIFNFFIRNRKIQFNFNYVEDSGMMKKALKLSLPSMQTKMSFYIDYLETYMTKEIFENMQKEGFVCSDKYLPQIKPSPLKFFSSNEKAEFKRNKLKITLIHNEKPIKSPIPVVTDLIPTPTDILIFVTGGGFIADFEKVAQFYLRQLIY